ncbi:MAG: hypothetical protein JXD19_02560 [Deltaproteobacteria bacterium]|nr:hypothetical protein [Deltaproteobacteria bacterium]
MKNVTLRFENHHYFRQILMAVLVCLARFLSYIFTKHHVIQSLRKLDQHTRTSFDAPLLRDELLKRISSIAPTSVFQAPAGHDLATLASSVLEKEQPGGTSKHLPQPSDRLSQ